MKPLDALQLQLRLEGFEILRGNRLRQVESLPGEEMPLLVLAQLAGGQAVAYFDESLDQNPYQELMDQTKLIQFPDIDPLINILNMQSIPFQVGHYKTSLFPTTYLYFVSDEVERCSRDDPLVQHFGFGGFAEQVYAISRDGKIVSACVSTREDTGCGEAWVCTDPQYRHHGLARQVVSAWARDMLAAGKVPFYSHRLENIASSNLAGCLGLLSLFEEISISYMNV
jgi:hypothetical protein